MTQFPQPPQSSVNLIHLPEIQESRMMAGIRMEMAAMAAVRLNAQAMEDMTPEQFFSTADLAMDLVEIGNRQLDQQYRQHSKILSWLSMPT